MPTRYTAKLVEEGQDFRSFALRCARALEETERTQNRNIWIDALYSSLPSE